VLPAKKYHEHGYGLLTRKLMWHEYLRERSPYRRVLILKEIKEIRPYLSSYYEETKLVLESRGEEQERAMDESNDIFEPDKIFNIVRILGWIKYFIIKSDGRVPNAADWTD
jgi:hypothetical protein